MPRQPRLIIPDVAVHIVQRGNDRMVCFRADGDFLVYLSELARLSAKFACALHAYCLMRNHVHLFVTPSRPHAEWIALASEPRARQLVHRALLEERLDRNVLDARRSATCGGYPLAAEELKSTLVLPSGRSLERARPGKRRKEKEQSVPDTDLLF